MSYDTAVPIWSNVEGTPFITVGPNADSGATYNGTNAAISAANAMPSTGGMIFLLAGTHGITNPAGVVMAPYNSQTWMGANGATLQAQAAMTWGVFNNYTNTNGHVIQSFFIDENDYAAYGFYWSNGTETSKGALSYIIDIQVLAGSGSGGSGGGVANFACFTNGNFNCQSGYEDLVWVACIAQGDSTHGLAFNIQVPGGEQTIISPKCFGKPFCINCVGAIITGSSIVSLLIGTGNAGTCGSTGNTNITTALTASTTTATLQKGNQGSENYAILGWGPTAEIIQVTGYTSPNITAMTRGALGSTAVAHPVGEPIAFGANLPLATLNGALTSSATTVAWNAANIAFTSADQIQVDNEVITLGTVSGNQATGCTRGANGTTATTHSSGAIVIEGITTTGGLGASGLISENGLICVNVQISDGGVSLVGSVPGGVFGIGSFNLTNSGFGGNSAVAGNGLPCVTVGAVDYLTQALAMGAQVGTFLECIFFPNSGAATAQSVFQIISMGIKAGGASHTNVAFGQGSGMLRVLGGWLKLSETAATNPTIQLFTFTSGYTNTYSNGMVVTDGWRIELDSGFSGAAAPIVSDSNAATATDCIVQVQHYNQACFCSGLSSVATYFQWNSKNILQPSVSSGSAIQNTTGNDRLLVLKVTGGGSAGTITIIVGPTSGSSSEFDVAYTLAASNVQQFFIPVRAGAWVEVTLSTGTLNSGTWF